MNPSLAILCGELGSCHLWIQDVELSSNSVTFHDLYLPKTFMIQMFPVGLGSCAGNHPHLVIPYTFDTSLCTVIRESK